MRGYFEAQYILVSIQNSTRCRGWSVYYSSGHLQSNQIVHFKIKRGVFNKGQGNGVPSLQVIIEVMAAERSLKERA